MLRLDCILPHHLFRYTPITPLSYLSTSLMSSLLSYDTTVPQWGYLTLDSTRKAVCLSIHDPLAVHRPSVGIWISGISTVNVVKNIRVWSACVAYYHNKTLQDRVQVSPSTFLVMVLSKSPTESNTMSVPSWYECRLQEEEHNSEIFSNYTSTCDVPLHVLQNPHDDEPDEPIICQFQYQTNNTLQEALKKGGDSTIDRGGGDSTVDRGYTEMETPLPRTTRPPIPMVTEEATEHCQPELESCPLDLVEEWQMNETEEKENVGSQSRQYHEILVAQQNQLAIMQRQIFALQSQLAEEKVTTRGTTKDIVVDRMLMKSYNVSSEEDQSDDHDVIEPVDHLKNISTTSLNKVLEPCSKSFEELSEDSELSEEEIIPHLTAPLDIMNEMSKSMPTFPPSSRGLSHLMNNDFDVPSIQFNEDIDEELSDDDDELRKIMLKYHSDNACEDEEKDGL